MLKKSNFLKSGDMETSQLERDEKEEKFEIPFLFHDDKEHVNSWK